MGDFNFVVSTKIDKATAERPHFFISYGTKSRDGLKAFRETEYAALRVHAKSRANAKEKKRGEQSQMGELFPGHEAEVQEGTIDDVVNDQKELASADLMAALLQHGEMTFAAVIERLLQAFMLRETNVKDICVDLARAGKIQNTWGRGNRKPQDRHMIKPIIDTSKAARELECGDDKR